jgi:hypothetical protein
MDPRVTLLDTKWFNLRLLVLRTQKETGGQLRAGDSQVSEAGGGTGNEMSFLIVWPNVNSER